jgi:ubiquinone/menaquinone biosynthesis C-methylase UbiE
MWNKKPARATDEVMHQLYETPGVADYSGKNLDKAEEVTLQELYDEIEHEPLLEIGVGGGRVTSHLLNISTQYVGIDYSNSLLALCKQRFPDADLRLCDARALSCFDSGGFHVVVLWGNAIDDVSPSDRLPLLREINRILKNNGILLLSSHNLDWNRVARSCGFEGLRSWTDLDFLRIRVYGRCLLSQFWTWIAQKDYAVFHEYIPEDERVPRAVVPCYYIRKEGQERQLAETGFTQISVMTMDGKQFTEASRSRDYMIFYTARKG